MLACFFATLQVLFALLAAAVIIIKSVKEEKWTANVTTDNTTYIDLFTMFLVAASFFCIIGSVALLRGW
jgi:heme/copper-type cytochrome/quinol oxidase subunit 3